MRESIFILFLFYDLNDRQTAIPSEILWGSLNGQVLLSWHKRFKYVAILLSFIVIFRFLEFDRECNVF